MILRINWFYLCLEKVDFLPPWVSMNVSHSSKISVNSSLRSWRCFYIPISFIFATLFLRLAFWLIFSLCWRLCKISIKSLCWDSLCWKILKNFKKVPVLWKMINISPYANVNVIWKSVLTWIWYKDFLLNPYKKSLQTLNTKRSLAFLLHEWCYLDVSKHIPEGHSFLTSRIWRKATFKARHASDKSQLWDSSDNCLTLT